MKLHHTTMITQLLLLGLFIGFIYTLIIPTSTSSPDNFAFAGFHDIYRWFVRPGLYAAMFGLVGFSLGLIVDGMMYFIY